MGGSGTAYHIEESVTSETTITEENTKSVEAALTQGAEFQVGTETSSATYKVETTRGWASSVSQTMSNMRSKGKTHSCGTQTCSGGVYQWFTDLTSDDEISGPKVTVGTCNFMCQEQDGPDYVPKCPMGSCNRNYWGDQGVGGNKASNSDGYQCPCCLPSVSKALAHLVCPSGEKLDSIALTAWAKAKIQKNEGTARLQKKNYLCANRGGAGASNQFSKRTGSDLKKCEEYVKSVDGCGNSFDLGADGWCDCVPAIDGDCKTHPQTGYNTYKIVSKYTATAELQNQNYLCANRGGAGASNQFSKHTGSDLKTCEKYVKSVDGCGDWFDLGTDGWCDCVPAIDGDCTLYPQTGYNTYKLV